VEQFNGYRKNSFITLLAATLKQAGLTLDVYTANAQIGPWLEVVANQRKHGTTKQTEASLPLKSLSNKLSPQIPSQWVPPLRASGTR
jgi:hypothetical protein